MWQNLSDADWRHHELNKFRGWILVILIYNCLGLIVIPVFLWVLVADPDSEFGLAVPGRPVAADYFVLAVDMLSSAVCLYAIWTRQFRAAEIYLATMLLFVLVGIGVEVIWSDPEFPFPLFVLVYAIIVALFVVAPVLYLFRGGRPNVIFKRRVRNAP